MAAPSHPSRFAELVDLIKEEYDRLSTENASFKGVRGEWSRKVEEQTSELNAMLAELRDLERKHQAVKEQYEAEIMRLKGQTPATGHPPPNTGMPSGLPHSTLTKHRMENPAQAPYSAVQGETPLPTMFASRPIPTGPGGQGAPGAGGQVRLSGISTLPPTPVAGGAGGIPAMNAGGIQRTNATGLSAKMPSMPIMPPNGTQGRDTSSMVQSIKKDPGLVGVQPSMAVNPAQIGTAGTDRKSVV